MESRELGPMNILEAIKRRKWSVIIPVYIALVSAALLIKILPPIYKCTATILIKEREIPDDFVTATVTTYVEQRLQSINQRIRSTETLSEIIDRFELNKNQKDLSNRAMIRNMRKNIKLETVSTEFMDRRTGKTRSAAIAFEISYQGKSPETVQKVTQFLTSLYLQENVRDRKERTMETSVFLKDEVERVKIDLAKIEEKISDFKNEHINELPELFRVNLQTLNNLERDIERLDDQLRGLKEKEGYIKTQLANIPSKLEDPNKKRLEELKLILSQLQSQYSDNYPDVMETKKEIAELEKKMKNDPVASKDDLPDNPAYITLASQVASTRTDINSIRKQTGNLKRKANLYRQRIENSPKLEQRYNELLSEQKTTHAKLDDLKRKLLEAKVAYGLEEEQKGESLILLEPPKIPERPDKPNRKAILLICMVLGLGAGVSLGVVREFADTSARDAESLASATSIPVLASIPEIVTGRDKRRKTLALVLVIVLVVVANIALFHFLVMNIGEVLSGISDTFQKN